jgi:hypothetical protein
VAVDNADGLIEVGNAEKLAIGEQYLANLPRGAERLVELSEIGSD